MSVPQTLTATTSVTFSRALADGHTLSGWLIGPTTDPSGQARARASHSALPEKVKELTTRGTFGPLFGGSSPSADLSLSLGSRLQARMPLNGSPEYILTWKRLDTRSGLPIFRLRASARRTSGKDYGGWQTPSVEDRGRAGSLTDYMNYVEKGQTSGCRLRAQVQAVGWPTPCQQDGPHGGPNQGVDRLPSAVQMAGWPTPIAMTGGQTSRGGDRKGEALMGGIVRGMAGWVSPTVQDYSRGTKPPRPQDTGIPLSQQVSGLTPPSSPAQMGNCEGLALNPLFSLYLQGFPPEWAYSVAPEIRSILG